MPSPPPAITTAGHLRPPPPPEKFSGGLFRSRTKTLLVTGSTRSPYPLFATRHHRHPLPHHHRHHHHHSHTTTVIIIIIPTPPLPSPPPRTITSTHAKHHRDNLLEGASGGGNSTKAGLGVGLAAGQPGTTGGGMSGLGQRV
ncbi:hypothetical protein Tco_0792912 [Tanacetum coccineum]